MRRPRRRAGIFLLALALLAFSFSPARAQAAPLTQVRYAMGTLWTVEAHGPAAEKAIAEAFAEIKRLDERLSTYRPDSELSRVNRDAASRWVSVSSETLALLGRALGYARETRGGFDPTVGPLIRTWGFKYLDYRVPDPKALAEARARVGFERVQLDPARGVRFLRPGVELDLGAIAKGYAVDRALTVMRGHGVTAARVDAGGNQGVFGSAGAEHPWLFGVKHPRSEGELLGVVSLSTGAVSTSGDAERGFWKDGVRHGHIVDPSTGAPVRGMLSVTVTAPTAEEADALSTSLYVLGPERGKELLARHPGCAALFVAAGAEPGAFRVEATPGMDWLAWD